MREKHREAKEEFPHKAAELGDHAAIAATILSLELDGSKHKPRTVNI
jgi:hypothetical protein